MGEATITTETAIVPVGNPSGLTKRELAKSQLYTNIKTPEQAAVVLAKAKSFGLCPTVVADNLFFVGGKPSLSAGLMATLVKKSGKYDYRVTEKTDKKCVITFFEILPGGQRDKLGVETFTMDNAKRAGLTGVNWTKFPEAMLFARCLTAGVRTHCPDALGGNPVYTVEELSPSTPVDDEGRPIIDGEIVDSPASADVERVKLALSAAGVKDADALSFVNCSAWNDVTREDLVKLETLANLKNKKKDKK